MQNCYCVAMSIFDTQQPFSKISQLELGNFSFDVTRHQQGVTVIVFWDSMQDLQKIVDLVSSWDFIKPT
jgi:hypothetical protein